MASVPPISSYINKVIIFPEPLMFLYRFMTRQYSSGLVPRSLKIQANILCIVFFVHRLTFFITNDKVILNHRLEEHMPNQ